MQKNLSYDTARRNFLRQGSLIACGCLVNSDIYSRPADFEQKELIQRAIGPSAEKIPVIGLGTWQTFDAGNDAARLNELKEVLKIFTASGGRVIDSSPMYGSSEEVVGDLCRKMQLREKLFIATKVWTSGRDNGINQMKASMQKMNAPVIDLMQVHNLVDVSTHMRTLKEWKEQGKIRYTGITHYMSSAYDSLISLIKKEKPDFVQFNYSLAEREAETKMLPFCRDQGIGVLINQPFSEGKLFRMVQNKPLPDWAKEYDIHSWAQYFLKYIVTQPAVTCAIPGTAKAKHMEDNMGAAFGKLPDANGLKKMEKYFTDL